MTNSFLRKIISSCRNKSSENKCFLGTSSSRGFKCYGDWSCTRFFLFTYLAWHCQYWYFIWGAGLCHFRRIHSFYFCWWHFTNDPRIVVLNSNKIIFSFSFRLIENDAIIFHRFKSFHELTLINICFRDMIEDSFFGYTLLIFVSDMNDSFNDLFFHIQSICSCVTRL